MTAEHFMTRPGWDAPFLLNVYAEIRGSMFLHTVIDSRQIAYIHEWGNISVICLSNGKEVHVRLPLKELQKRLYQRNGKDMGVVDLSDVTGDQPSKKTTDLSAEFNCVVEAFAEIKGEGPSVINFNLYDVEKAEPAANFEETQTFVRMKNGTSHYLLIAHKDYKTETDAARIKKGSPRVDLKDYGGRILTNLTPGPSAPHGPFHGFNG